MKTVLLRAPPFLGDEIVFTGAVRELWRETGWSLRVQTKRPELWRYNETITGLGSTGSEDLKMKHSLCPQFRLMNDVPVHYLDQYVRNLRSAVGLRGSHKIERFAGEVPLGPDELELPPLGIRGRYWVIVAGCKTDVPVKGWGSAQYQEVVNSLQGRVRFVQAGSKQEWHPSLAGVVDAVGQTPLRELIQLIYHAEGVLCPITSIMHLAAALPAAPASPFAIRPCVVIAGGREAPHFINYPMHRVMHTVGLLDCCSRGGCGKNRFGMDQCPFPIKLSTEEQVPLCMTLITPADVIAAIEFYYRGKAHLAAR